MMGTVLKKQLSGSRIRFLFGLVIFLLYGCMNTETSKEKERGTYLECFKFDNQEVDSIVHLMVNYSKENKDYLNEQMVLELVNDIDSIRLDFSFQNYEDLINKYIFFWNKRIVGYAVVDNTNIVILSNVNILSDFSHCFSIYMHPTGKNKFFRTIYFPSNQYYDDTQKGWNHGSIIYDPVIYSFGLKNGRVSSCKVFRE